MNIVCFNWFKLNVNPLGLFFAYRLGNCLYCTYDKKYSYLIQISCGGISGA